MKQSFFKLLLDLDIYEVPLNFKHFPDIPLDILNSLITHPNHQYLVKSKVSEEIFRSFTNYLVHDKVPDIQISNINDYIQLSREFHVLEKELEDKKIQYGEFLVNLTGLRNQSHSPDSPIYEEGIASKLDEYLDNYGEELMKLPIQSLFNIFNHSKRKLANHNLAYEEIVKRFERSQDGNIFVLLESIDGTKLSKENLRESISKQKERNNFMPKIDFDFMSNYFDKQQEMEAKIISLQQENKSMNDKQQNLEKKIISLQQENKSMNDKQQNLEKKIISMQQEYKSMNDKQQKLESENKYLTQKIEEFQNKFDLINKKHEQDIQMLSKQINENIVSEIDLLKSKNEKLVDQLNQHKKLINENKQVMNQLTQKPTAISFPLANNEYKGIINYLKSRGNIDNEISFSYSSNNQETHTQCYGDIHNITLFDDLEKGFYTKNLPNSWICLKFNNYKIIPTNYSIRTCHSIPFLKSWVIEACNDNKSWEIIDEQKNCDYLNGYNNSHSFSIGKQNGKGIQYIRIRQIETWHSYSSLGICAFEIYGSLI